MIRKISPKTPFAKRLMQLIGTEKNSVFEQRTGLANGSVSRYCGNVEPKLSAIIAILQATGCSADWLLLGKGEPFPDKS